MVLMSMQEVGNMAELYFAGSLFAASISGKLDTVQALLDCGVDQNLTNSVTSTSVQAAAMHGDSALQKSAIKASYRLYNIFLSTGPIRI